MTARRTRLLGAAALLVLGMPLLIDALVLTDEEAIQEQLDALEEAIEAQDLDAILACFAPDYESSARLIPSRGVDQLRRSGQRWLDRLDEVRIAVERQGIAVEGPAATVTIETVFLVRGPEGRGPWQVDVLLEMQDRAGVWRITRVVELRLRAGAF